MAELLERSHAVVMDLRAFGRDNAGCIDEIEMLASRDALNRTVLLVDGSTDRRFLDEVLGAGAQRPGPTLVTVGADDEANQAVVACLAAASEVVAGHG